MSTSVVSYQNDSLERPALTGAVSHIVTTPEDTANTATIALTGIGPVKDVLSVQIASTANVRRAPQGAVTFTDTSVTVADTGLAVGEKILVLAVGYNA